MSILKCKMCGGDLEITDNMFVCKCEYCGTRQTIPKADNEQKINAMNRANHFRRQCEFDRAIEVYEKILQNSPEDAELYWTLALCKYGIEYVDDSRTGKKIPTCHRMQYTSILDDVDYKEAMELADEAQKSIYREEAETISAIQKDILDISKREKPFDVFICYKELDDSGNRTQDSVLAQDIYFGLTEKGFKVFFSRITLEGKLGTAYEPYIFAALNSAKVMIVVSTKPEYVNAVWVKNEWSRFLMLMQNDKHKLIIPAYRGMDPYDLPDALSIYQSQDMSKLGFMQDLIRGVSKVLDGEKEVVQETQAVVSNELNVNIVSLIKRGNLALEDGEWDRAYEFFDQILNIDAEYAEAYLWQLFSKNKVSNVDEYISVLLQNTEDARPATHSKQIPAEQIEYVENLLKENAIHEREYILELQECKYLTYEESRIEQKEQMLSFFETDKLLKKAVRFAKGDSKKMIDQLKNGVISAMDTRIQEAITTDKIAEEEAEKVVFDVYQRLLEKIKKVIEDKAARYEKLVADYNVDKWRSNLETAKTMQKAFINFGEYREAFAYAEKIGNYISEMKEKLQALEEEKRIICNSFMKLSLFDKQKKAELEKKLRTVSDEIDRIKSNI